MDHRLVIACVLASACTAAPAPIYPVTVHVESDPGVPLAGASVVSAGNARARSDDQGVAYLTLEGEAGARIPLLVQCPKGFRQPSEALSVVLRAEEPGAPAPEYAVRCPPSLRSLVVSVRAQNAAGVPLLRLGRELVRTDDQGAANALLKLSPGEDLTVVLDTSAPEHATLRPRNPSLTLTMPDRDDIVLFDQPFTVDPPRRHTRAAAVHGPPRPL